MFRIKICGITTQEDALAAVDAGADALGLNFYPQSKRYVTPERAKQIAAAIPSDVERVGVFVNASREMILDAFDSCLLDWVQLHGNEGPEFIASLPADLQVLWVFRQIVPGLEGVGVDLLRCQELGRLVDAVLIDAYVDDKFGGTGSQADWNKLVGWKNIIEDQPMVLAGGLTPNNIASAVKQVVPTAVDTASGVESSPGVKDFAKMQAFVEAARKAFAEI